MTGLDLRPLESGHSLLYLLELQMLLRRERQLQNLPSSGLDQQYAQL
jgi:hypothetical protein